MNSSNPILTEIFRLSEESRTGTLILGSDQETIKLHFHDGLISAAASNLSSFQLGRFLSDCGFIEKSTIAHLLDESCRKKRLIGETAVKHRLIGKVDLSILVQDQAVRLIMHALTTDFKIRNFNDSGMLFALPAQLSSQQLMLELARRSLRPIAPEPHRQIVLSNGCNLTNLSWYPQELSVLEQLKQPRTMQELAISTGLEYTRLCKILSVLDSMKMISSLEEEPSNSTAVIARRELSYESLVPEIQKNGLSDKLEVYHNHTSFISEQFKTLKVHLYELSRTRPVQVITITSPHTQDGKSLVSTNLALSYSKDPQRRVVLLDCDLRNPTIHQYLGTSMEPGLYGFLTTEFLQPYCYMRRLDRLFIMTTGGIADNPIELLSQGKMQQLIEHLKRDFNTIILDTPPLVPVSDAHVLTNLSDGMLIVIRSNKTTYTNMDRAFRMLDRNKVLGIVLNDVQPRLFHTNYDYRYYGYGNRSIYPYGQKKVESRRHRTYFE